MASPFNKFDFAWRRSVALVSIEYLGVLCIGCIAAKLQPFEHPILVALIADLAATVAVFFCSFIHGNSSCYDPYWHVAPPPLALYWISQYGYTLRSFLIFSLLLAWSMRLTWNWLRGWSGLGHEDWRYASFKNGSGPQGPQYWLLSSLLGFHLFPTLVVFAAMLPLWAAVSSTTVPVCWMDMMACSVGAAAVLMQATADNQLRAYRRAKPPRPGQFGAGIADVGLWRWSRHPNYFGELSHWFSYSLFAIAAGNWLSDRFWTLLGWVPLCLLFVGASIPLMESRQLKSKPRYAEYQRMVPMFIPIPRWGK